MTQEEKAKAYDRAIIEFKPIYNLAKEQGRAIDVKEFERIFPELKESEDERIKKSLIGHLKECRNNTRSEVMLDEYAKWIAWLEKQNQVKETAIPQHENKTCKENDDSLTSENEKIRNWLIEYFRQYKEDGMEKYANGLKVDSILAWLEKQGKRDAKKVLQLK